MTEEDYYVWARQVDAARRNGVREEAIDLIRRKGDPAELPPEEREIVVYARQLAETNRVDQAACLLRVAIFEQCHRASDVSKQRRDGLALAVGSPTRL